MGFKSFAIDTIQAKRKNVILYKRTVILTKKNSPKPHHILSVIQAYKKHINRPSVISECYS